MEEGGKRKLGEYILEEEEDGENFKFQHRDKRPVNDIWDDEDWDPRTALGGLRVRVKEERRFGEGRSTRTDPEGSTNGAVRHATGAGLKREEWSGKLVLEPQIGLGSGKNGKETENDRVREGLVFIPDGGGWVKAEPEADGIGNAERVKMSTHETFENGHLDGDSDTIKKEPIEASELDEPRGETSLFQDTSSLNVKLPDVETSASSSLFKKRRPPAGARKK